MKLAGFVITAVVVGLSGPAFAQTTTGQPTATNPPPVYQPVGNTSYDNGRNWIVSGFLGTNFHGNRNDDNVQLFDLENVDSGATSATFGGQVAYLGAGIIGGEFLAEFSPNISTFNNLLFENSPNVATYMINAIAVAPFGDAHSYEPYVSGGVGWVGLHATIFTIDPTLTPDINLIGTESVHRSRFGWDLGGGLMAWSEKNWGFRGDVRYYRTRSNDSDVFDLNNIGDGSDFLKVELSGVSFWKANAGVSFRW